VRPARPDPVKLLNDECGAEPIEEAWVPFPVGLHPVAFVFGALAVSSSPWSPVLRTMELGAVFSAP
jgi:hypothetical protein